MAYEVDLHVYFDISKGIYGLQQLAVMETIILGRS